MDGTHITYSDFTWKSSPATTEFWKPCRRTGGTVSGLLGPRWLRVILACENADAMDK